MNPNDGEKQVPADVPIWRPVSVTIMTAFTIGKSYEEVTLEFGKANSVFTSGSPKSTEYIYGDYPVFVLKVDDKNRVFAFTCDS